MVEIIKAGSKDFPTIQEVAEVAFRDTYKEILSPEQMEYMMDMMYSTPNLYKQAEEGHIYYIAYENNKAVGFVSIQPQEKDLYHLQKIYVLPSCQGQGLGKLLFQQAISAIKGLHPTPCVMELNVNRHNKALHFYEKMGMHKDREGDFPIGNGYYMNDYIMAIEISEA